MRVEPVAPYRIFGTKALINSPQVLIRTARIDRAELESIAGAVRQRNELRLQLSREGIDVLRGNHTRISCSRNAIKKLDVRCARCTWGASNRAAGFCVAKEREW